MTYVTFMSGSPDLVLGISFQSRTFREQQHHHHVVNGASGLRDASR
jgi:hypothetical protein